MTPLTIVLIRQLASNNDLPQEGDDILKTYRGLVFFVSYDELVGLIVDQYSSKHCTEHGRSTS